MSIRAGQFVVKTAPQADQCLTFTAFHLESDSTAEYPLGADGPIDGHPDIPHSRKYNST